MTMTLIESSASHSSSRSKYRADRAPVQAFIRSGRFRVRIAMPGSLRSNRTRSSLIRGNVLVIDGWDRLGRVGRAGVLDEVGRLDGIVDVDAGTLVDDLVDLVGRVHRSDRLDRVVRLVRLVRRRHRFGI